MTQGDVYWYTFRPPDKRRPVLILTRNSAISFLTGITVAPLTTTIRGIPTEVILTPADDGVFADCAVNVDNIQTIQKSNLGAHITRLSLDRMREVRASIAFALGFDSLT
ncbi:MAG TPA: type II toxin-antitoxin system PemK/MazF family toxin [Pyrinomonadaceae bacterium]|jgi:mRNA interferase MazF